MGLVMGGFFGFWKLWCGIKVLGVFWRDVEGWGIDGCSVGLDGVLWV